MTSSDPRSPRPGKHPSAPGSSELRGGESSKLPTRRTTILSGGGWLAILRYNGVLILTVITAVGLSIGVDRFATGANISNVLEGSSLVGIVAMGMAILLISGNFDLSVPGTVQLGGIFLATVINQTNTPLGIIAVLAFGIVVGTVNGLIVTKLGVNSLIATLGTGFVMTGLTLVFTNGSPIPIQDQSLTIAINSRPAGIPLTAIIWLLVAVAATWLLHFTVLGRQIRAVGSNAQASRLAGVNVTRVRLIPFIITGFASSLTAVVAAGIVDAGDPNVGATFALEAIAAAVVGGVAITGGIGIVPMAVVGVLLINIIRNAFILTNLNSNFEQVLTGAILILAVAFDAGLGSRKTIRFSRRKPRGGGIGEGRTPDEPVETIARQ